MPDPVTCDCVVISVEELERQQSKDLRTDSYQAGVRCDADTAAQPPRGPPGQDDWWGDPTRESPPLPLSPSQKRLPRILGELISYLLRGILYPLLMNI